MATMTKRHMKMIQRMLAMMKSESDYELIDEIRILNDGGGTGTWHVAIKPAGKRVRAANFPMLSIFAEPERVDPDEYYNLQEGEKDFV